MSRMDQKQSVKYLPDDWNKTVSLLNSDEISLDQYVRIKRSQLLLYFYVSINKYVT